MSEPWSSRLSVTNLSQEVDAPRLTRFAVADLFGKYDHVLDLPTQDPFKIIYGPNGIGKTQMFRLINSIAKSNWAWLTFAPFSSATMHYEGDLRLRVDRESLDDGTTGLHLSLIRGKRAIVEDWRLNSALAAEYRDLLERSTWRPLPAPGLWRDDLDGEILTEEQLSDRHGWNVPETPLSPTMRHLLAATEVRLIETQRLSLIEDETLSNNTSDPYMFARNRPGARPPGYAELSTVSKYSEFMQEELASLLAANSRVTQTLDRTFPSRLLAPDASPIMPEMTIRKAYIDLNARRRRLAEISLLERELDVPLPDSRLEDWQRLVLTTYLRDSEQKLAGFAAMVERIDLLEDIINGRFLGKALRVTVGAGLGLSTDSGKTITADQLSSGEQHELVLMFALLFTVRAGSVILIDEPEISLHISWQRRFMSDIEKIARLGDFRFIVATHSPAIIDRWRAFSQNLAPGMDE